MTSISSPSGAHQSFSMELLNADELVNFDGDLGGKVETTFVNSLDCDVWVADRQGGVAKVPSNGRWPNLFCIQVVRRYGNGVKVTLNNPVRETTFGTPRESTVDKAVKENYLNRSSSSSWNPRDGRTKDLSLKATKEKIMRLGGSFYHPETDLVVSLSEERAIHHGSPKELLKQQRETIRPGSGSDGHPPLKVGVCIIDNTFKVGDKFVYLLGEVHRISPIRDTTKEEGVYVYRDTMVTEDGGIVYDDLHVYPLGEESFDKLGFFKSYQAALHWVNELKENSEIRLAQKKAALAEAKVENEKSSLERKDAYEEKGTRRKDYYEETSYQRKDSSEEIKWILGMVATLLGVAAIFGRK